MPTEQQIIAAERVALRDLLAAIPLRSVDENVVIASWNIAQFSDRKKARAIQYIADICERFDIVAIQEVKTNLRQKEIEELVRFIKREAKRAKHSVFDPDFFLVGDFNIQSDGDRFFTALAGGDPPRFVMPAGMNTAPLPYQQASLRSPARRHHPPKSGSSPR